MEYLLDEEVIRPLIKNVLGMDCSQFTKKELQMIFQFAWNAIADYDLKDAIAELNGYRNGWRGIVPFIKKFDEFIDVEKIPMVDIS